ncbi:class I SAM-dependent methyltransferase [uncultured Brachyspira sp.]|uniref:class I SAM-dependent methyltransferase n=1 Tax=uncultured Brachyspira sp. TaxID=221953 RepID=UPI0026103705|nr:class I SAM-dependent methyltransferase [uncultured Brachyspira sp.]
MFLENPVNYEDNILNRIKIYEEYSLMSDVDRKFLNGVIREAKPKKVLEIGVFAGMSSAIILNAIKDFKDSFLYSVDYNTLLFNDKTKKSGFILEKKEYSNLLDRHKLYTGGVTAKFIEEIGGDIDLCFIDTAHINPGEFMDILMVLPYLKKNAVVIIHDVSSHTFSYQNNKLICTCGVLFSALKGRKIIPNDGIFNTIGNIGAVILDDDILDRVYDYFHLLTLPWEYLPTDEDIDITKNIFLKYYDKKYVDMFVNIYSYHKKEITAMNDNIKNETVIKDKSDLEERVNTLESRLLIMEKYVNRRFDKIINKVAWFIPFRGMRDNFRNDLIE